VNKMAPASTIEVEWFALRDALDNVQIEEMLRLGVDGDLILYGVAVGVTRVSFDAWGTYQPDEFGERAMIVAVRRGGLDLETPDPIGATLYGDLADLAAVAIEPPHRAAVRLGLVSIGGCIEPRLLSPRRVDVRSVLAWLRAGGEGLGVIDPEGAAAELLGVRELRFHDVALAHAVNDAIRASLHLPMLVVAERAAA